MSRTNLGEPALLVLAALASGPKHGYAVIVEVEAHTGRRLGPGTLYGIIERLEKGGLIAPMPVEERGRRPYRITNAGKRAFDDEVRSLQQYQRALRTLASQ